jgi:hypothetical protein
MTVGPWLIRLVSRLWWCLRLNWQLIVFPR